MQKDIHSDPQDFDPDTHLPTYYHFLERCSKHLQQTRKRLQYPAERKPYVVCKKCREKAPYSAMHWDSSH